MKNKQKISGRGDYGKNVDFIVRLSSMWVLVLSFTRSKTLKKYFWASVFIFIKSRTTYIFFKVVMRIKVLNLVIGTPVINSSFKRI